MKRIFKYPLTLEGSQIIIMTKDAEILTVQMQNGDPMIWSIVDDKIEETEGRVIDTYGTGHDIIHPIKKYIGTYQLLQGRLIFHVFERL